MTAQNQSEEEHIDYHRDGSVRARGKMREGVLTGCWEWFRKDGTPMRSGSFEEGEQVGEWTTFDSAGQVYKVTRMKPKGEAGTSPARH
jgi:antitoxin component YwqK of YwqJK toxin-antitoxin module